MKFVLVSVQHRRTIVTLLFEGGIARTQRRFSYATNTSAVRTVNIFCENLVEKLFALTTNKHLQKKKMIKFFSA